MNSKHLNGLTVLSIEDGEKLGTVSRAYVDATAKRIAGFAYTESSGFMKVESEPKLDAEEVRSLGPDTLTLDNKQAGRGASVSERYSSLLVLEDMVRRPVLSENGTSVGQIASIDFDNHSFGLTRIEVSPGFFKDNRTIPIDKVVTLGRDYVIVDDSVCQSTEVPDAEPSTTIERITTYEAESTPRTV